MTSNAQPTLPEPWPSLPTRAPLIAAGAFVGSWMVGLGAFPAGPALDAPVSDVAAFYVDRAGASSLQAVVVHGGAAIALLVVVSAIRNRVRGSGIAGRAGLVAVVLSLAQLALELVRGSGAGSMKPETIDELFDAVNRLDGLKMLALATLVAASSAPLRAAAVTGRWTVAVGWVTAVALVASGVGFVALDAGIATAAYVSLPLLLVWVARVGWALHRTTQ